MIIKYAYAYASPNGTFYVGLRDGVITMTMTATVMSSMASQPGGVLAEVRRQVEAKIGNDELFELINVTPAKITERGIYTGEEVKELYGLVKFDSGLDAAMKSYAAQVHEALEEARNPLDEIKVWIRSLVKEEVTVDAQVDPNDPQVINVQLKVPMSYIEVAIKGGLDGSQNRT